MRFYLKQVIQWVLVTCIVIVLMLNLYRRDIWVYEDANRPLPWGADFRENIHGPELHFDESLEARRELFNRHAISSTSFTARPTNNRTSPLVYYSNHYDDDDRILSQLKFIPESVKKARQRNEEPAIKTILLYNGMSGWQVQKGQSTFQDQQCAVQNCFLTDNKQEGQKADAVLFHHSPSRPWFVRPLGQVWILFLLESPYHTAGLKSFRGVYNWTATYRHDSTIVAPYEKYVPYNASVLTKKQSKNYAMGKTKKVAWFVSNCGARNGRRAYADELGKHIKVDIYGACGTLKCPRYQNNKCFDMLNKDYKFYLSFENSNCRDYITEKFFVNGLQNDVIPIVMGGAPVDYVRAAPRHSFIHVDDFESPAALAQYLHHLDSDDVAYNEYFQWKGTGSFINTFFWCRVCAMLHDVSPKHSHSYSDLDNWWRGPKVCIGMDSWRNKSMDLS